MMENTGEAGSITDVATTPNINLDICSGTQIFQPNLWEINVYEIYETFGLEVCSDLQCYCLVGLAISSAPLRVLKITVTTYSQHLLLLRTLGNCCL